MLLALDMGNTNITIGVYEKDSLRFESRLATGLCQNGGSVRGGDHGYPPSLRH